MHALCQIADGQLIGNGNGLDLLFDLVFCFLFGTDEPAGLVLLFFLIVGIDQVLPGAVVALLVHLPLVFVAVLLGISYEAAVSRCSASAAACGPAACAGPVGSRCTGTSLSEGSPLPVARLTLSLGTEAACLTGPCASGLTTVTIVAVKAGGSALTGCAVAPEGAVSALAGCAVTAEGTVSSLAGCAITAEGTVSSLTGCTVTAKGTVCSLAPFAGGAAVTAEALASCRAAILLVTDCRSFCFLAILCLGCGSCALCRPGLGSLGPYGLFPDRSLFFRRRCRRFCCGSGCRCRRFLNGCRYGRFLNGSGHRCLFFRRLGFGPGRCLYRRGFFMEIHLHHCGNDGGPDRTVLPLGLQRTSLVPAACSCLVPVLRCSLTGLSVSGAAGAVFAGSLRAALLLTGSAVPACVSAAAGIVISAGAAAVIASAVSLTSALGSRVAASHDDDVLFLFGFRCGFVRFSCRFLSGGISCSLLTGILAIALSG